MWKQSCGRQIRGKKSLEYRFNGRVPQDGFEPPTSSLRMLQVNRWKERAYVTARWSIHCFLCAILGWVASLSWTKQEHYRRRSPTIPLLNGFALPTCRRPACNVACSGVRLVGLAPPNPANRSNPATPHPSNGCTAGRRRAAPGPYPLAC